MLTIGVAVAVLDAVVVAFMLELPMVVVSPPPTRTVTDLEVVVTTVWLPVDVAVEFCVKVEVTRSPSLIVIVVLYTSELPMGRATEPGLVTVVPSDRARDEVAEEVVEDFSVISSARATPARSASTNDHRIVD